MRFDKEIDQEFDQDLIRRCLAGDSNCYAVLVDRYQPMVRSLVGRLIDDEVTAEEVAHDAFVRAWEKLEQFAGNSRFSTWVGQIALNLARDHLRQRCRRPHESLSDSVSEQLVGDDGDGFVDELDRHRWADWLQQGMARVRPDERELLTMIYLEEQSYATVARYLQCSTGAAKVRGCRARQSLKRALGSGALSARLN